jgi:hypothetical protein
MLEYQERGLNDKALEVALGVEDDHNQFHYWRRGEYEPSREMQERAVDFLRKAIAVAKAGDHPISVEE